MNKIEQNDFLYTLLTNPEDFVTDDHPFEFHPLTTQIDNTLIWSAEVQYITVEGAQLGMLYLSPLYLMFKSKPERIDRNKHKFAMKVNLLFIITILER